METSRILVALGMVLILLGGVAVLNNYEDGFEEKITVASSYPKVCSMRVIDYSMGGMCILNQKTEGGIPNMETESYQGPVPLGYDLQHFRETGETIKEVIE